MFGQRLPLLVALVLLIVGTAQAGQKSTRLRFGYLDDPGSTLALLAAQQGHFAREGLAVTLVKYGSSSDGIADLAAGKIGAGAFRAGDILRAIANNADLQIIAGGGTLKPSELQPELDKSAPGDLRTQEVVTVIRRGKDSRIKETAIRLVSSQIRAYQELQQHESQALHAIRSRLSHPSLPGDYRFDPNPEYYRFAAVWNDLELQRPGMRRDHLSSHLYEEVYCDALDRALDADPQNELIKKLASVAVCVPDCCPDAKKQKIQKTKGAAP